MNKNDGGTTASTASITEALDPDLLDRIASQTLARELQLGEATFNPLLDLADRLVERKNWTEAFDLFSRLGLVDPANLDVQLGLARCATGLGEHEIAIKAAANVIRLAPSDPRGYLLSGKNCLMIGQLQEAREDLADAVRLAGDETALAAQASLLLSQLETLDPGKSGKQSTRG